VGYVVQPKEKKGLGRISLKTQFGTTKLMPGAFGPASERAFNEIMDAAGVDYFLVMVGQGNTLADISDELGVPNYYLNKWVSANITKDEFGHARQSSAASYMRKAELSTEDPVAASSPGAAQVTRAKMDHYHKLAASSDPASFGPPKPQDPPKQVVSIQMHFGSPVQPIDLTASDIRPVFSDGRRMPQVSDQTATATFTVDQPQHAPADPVDELDEYSAGLDGIGD
jgi:hypothetical protein